MFGEKLGGTGLVGTGAGSCREIILETVYDVKEERPKYACFSIVVIQQLSETEMAKIEN